MAKQEWIKVSFAELHDDLILLKITNLHKYIANLANKIAKYS